MPDGASAYTDALLHARATGYAIGRGAVLQLEAAFQHALDALMQDAATGAITAERATALMRQIVALLAQLERGTVTVTTSAMQQLLRQVAAVHAETVRDLARLAGLPETATAAIGTSLTAVPTRAVQALAARGETAATFQTLMRRHVLDAAPALDTLLTSAVARGVSARRLTTDIAQLLAGDNPALDPYGVGPGDVVGLRSLQSDARRIAVTEINNALREGNRQSLLATPIVEAVKWQLSGAHPEPDECDVLAEADLYGLGPGYYPPEAFPLAPHPHCACTQGGPVRLRPVSTWTSARPAPPPANLGALALPRDLSEKRAARMRTTLLTALAA